MPRLRVAGGAPQGRHCKAGAAEPAACYCAANQSVWLQPGGWESISCNRTGASCCGSAQDRLPELRGAVTASGAPGKLEELCCESCRGRSRTACFRPEPVRAVLGNVRFHPHTGARAGTTAENSPEHLILYAGQRSHIAIKRGRHVCPHRLGFENDGYANMQITVQSIY